MMKIFYSPLHEKHDPLYEGYNAEGNMPSYEKALRAEIVRTALNNTNWAEFLTPSNFGTNPILAVHSAEYIDYLQSAYAKWRDYSPVDGMAFIPGTYTIDYEHARSLKGNEQAGFFLMDTTVAITPGTFAAAQSAAACALSSAQALLTGEKVSFALTRPPGHHAGTEVCGGYCYFNNAAIAAEWLSQTGKTAILDVDYHAGNGTQQIFYQNPNVLTVSLHADPTFEYPYYGGLADQTGEGPGYGFHRNYPLPRGTDQTQYLRSLEQALKLINEFVPNYLVISAGMDTYYKEPLGSFNLSQESIYMIGKQIASLRLPSLIVMEGGYHLPSLGDNFVAFLEPFVE
jgi:acetoin utilization deacetylase AcuC-like enzyme